MEEKKASKEAANELKFKLELLREEAEIKHKEKEKELEKEKERKLEKEEERKEAKITDTPEVNEEIAKTDDDDDDEKTNCLVECLNFTYPPLKQPGDSKKWIAHVDKAFTDEMWLDVVGMKSGLGLLFKDNCMVLKQLFKEQVILVDKMEAIRCPSDAKRYFANCMHSGTELYCKNGRKFTQGVERRRSFPF